MKTAIAAPTFSVVGDKIHMISSYTDIGLKVAMLYIDKQQYCSPFVICRTDTRVACIKCLKTHGATKETITSGMTELLQSFCMGEDNMNILL